MEQNISIKNYLDNINKKITFIDDEEGLPDGSFTGSYRRMVVENHNLRMSSWEIPNDNYEIKDIKEVIDSLQEQFLLRKIPIDITYNKYRYIIISETYDVDLPNDWDKSSLIKEVKTVFTLGDRLKKYDIIQKVDEIYANDTTIYRYEKDYLINFLPRTSGDVFNTQHFSVDRLTPETDKIKFSINNLHYILLSTISIRLDQYIKNAFNNN